MNDREVTRTPAVLESVIGTTDAIGVSMASGQEWDQARVFPKHRLRR